MNETVGNRASGDTGGSSPPGEIGADVIALDRDRIAARLRRDRNQTAWPVVGLGCFLLIQIGLLAPNIWLIGRRFAMDETLKSDLRIATLVSSTIWIGIGGIMVVAVIRRRRRLAELIESIKDETRSPDAVCPNCGGAPFQQDVCCPRFPQAWSPKDLHRFWHDRVALGDEAATFRRGTPPTTLTQSFPNRLATLVLGVRTNPDWDRRIICCFIVAALFAIFVFRPSLLFPGSFEFMMIASVLLFLLAGESLSKRRGSRSDRVDLLPRCLECDQLIDPGMGRCPECGNTARTGTIHYTGVRRNQRRSFRVLLPTVLLMGVALGLLFFAGDVVRFITGRLPDAALVSLAPYDEDVFHPIWTEVIARPLDDIQSDRLFDVLATRLEIGDEVNSWHPGLIAVAGGTWPNGLDAGQIDRIHAASWPAEVDAPPTIAAGVPFDVTLVGDRRAEVLPFGEYLHVLFDGVSIDDGPFLHPDDSMVWTLVANRDADQAPTTSGRRRFQRRITIDEPGPHRIRLAYRLVAGPGGLVDAAVDRDDSGESLPPATAAWSRRFEIEHRIDVKD